MTEEARAVEREERRARVSEIVARGVEVSEVERARMAARVGGSGDVRRVLR